MLKTPPIYSVARCRCLKAPGGVSYSIRTLPLRILLLHDSLGPEYCARLAKIGRTSRSFERTRNIGSPPRATRTDPSGASGILINFSLPMQLGWGDCPVRSGIKCTPPIKISQFNTRASRTCKILLCVFFRTCISQPAAHCGHSIRLGNAVVHTEASQKLRFAPCIVRTAQCAMYAECFSHWECLF